MTSLGVFSGHGKKGNKYFNRLNGLTAQAVQAAQTVGTVFFFKLMNI
jgi:hypothetical protein